MTTRQVGTQARPLRVIERLHRNTYRFVAAAIQEWVVNQRFFA